MPVESNAEIDMAVFAGLENKNQQDAPSTKNPTLEEWIAHLDAERLTAQMEAAGFSNLAIKSPTSGSEIETPRSNTPAISSTHVPPEFKTPRKQDSKPSCSFVGYTIGKRKVFGEEDGDSFESKPIIHNAIMKKKIAEKKIRTLELRYDCDLSKKRIKADRAKQGSLEATINRLQTEIQMHQIHLESILSKKELYDEVIKIRTVAKLSENIDPSLRSEPTRSNEFQDAEDEYQALLQQAMRAKERRDRAMGSR